MDRPSKTSATQPKPAERKDASDVAESQPFSASSAYSYLIEAATKARAERLGS